MPALSILENDVYDINRQVIDIKAFSWYSETSTFVQELSMLRDVVPTHLIEIKNFKTGKSATFTRTKIDTTSGGDIAGYRYVSTCGLYNLLLIND